MKFAESAPKGLATALSSTEPAGNVPLWPMADMASGHRLSGREADRSAIVIARGDDDQRALGAGVLDGEPRGGVARSPAEAHVDEIATLGYGAVDRLGNREVRGLILPLSKDAVAAQRYTRSHAANASGWRAARGDDPGDVGSVTLGAVVAEV